MCLKSELLNLLKPVDTLRTAKFSSRIFYVLPTESIYLICMAPKQPLFIYTALADWVLRRVRKTAKTDYQLRHVCLCLFVRM